MTTQPQLPVDTEQKRQARGRKDSTGQEAVIELTPLKKSISDLIDLHEAYVDARGSLNDAVKAVAERSGLQASVVRKLVNARATDRFAQEKVKVDQAALAFEEVGEETFGNLDVGNGKPKPKKLKAADSAKPGPDDEDDRDGDGDEEEDAFAGSDLARNPPPGITADTAKRLEEASADAAKSAERKAANVAAGAIANASKAKH